MKKFMIGDILYFNHSFTQGGEFIGDVFRFEAGPNDNRIILLDCHFKDQSFETAHERRAVGKNSSHHVLNFSNDEKISVISPIEMLKIKAGWMMSMVLDQ